MRTLRRTLERALPLALGAVLTACAQAPLTWIGPGPVAYDGPGTLDEFLKIHRQCHQEVSMGVVGGSMSPYAEAAGASTAPSCAALAACLARHGYRRAENGRLVIPASQVLPCAGG